MCENILILNECDLKELTNLFSEHVDQSIETSISFIVICKDEARCIERCIKSIVKEKTLEDEIIIIDTGSIDNTKDIIRSYNECKLYEVEWRDDFSYARNFGINKASKEWIFFIDADETLEKKSAENLKKVLQCFSGTKVNDVVITPSIINTNKHTIREVKRIFRRKSNIMYYGAIHEEPRKKDEMLGTDLISININNVILMHDGYEREYVVSKNKVNRNVHLLYKMIELEPKNPRWKYFLCRDGSSMMTPSDLEKMLEEVIELSGSIVYFQRYKRGAYGNLVNYYINSLQFEKAEFYISELERMNLDFSEINYYKGILRYQKQQTENISFVRKLIKYRGSKYELEYGGIHSSFFHLDELIAMYMFEIGQYETAFHIYEILEENGYGKYRKAYSKLYLELKKFVEV